MGGQCFVLDCCTLLFRGPFAKGSHRPLCLTGDLMWSAKGLRQFMGSISIQKCPREGGKALRRAVTFIGPERLFYIQKKYTKELLVKSNGLSTHNPTFQKQALLVVSIFNALDISKHLNDLS